MISRLRRSYCTTRVAAHALAEVLVGRDDEHLLDALVGVGDGGGRAEGVVGLVLDHRPRRHAHRHERLLDDRDLGEQLGRHPGARLVAGPQVVAEALDDVVAGHADVGGAVGEQLQRRAQHAGRRRERARRRAPWRARPKFWRNSS